MQRIAPSAAAALALPRVDLSELPAAGREDEARRLARAAAERPFDLARGPLVTALLVRLAPADHLLILVPHHLVFDGWSMGILFRELAELYGAFARGQPSPLPPPAFAYADFADWQRRALDGPAREGQLAYWRGRLAGLPGLDLPTDRPRPPAPSFRGSFVARQLPPRLAGALAALCRRQGVTLFMAVLAAWDLLLARLSGQRDFPVGAPVAGRSRPETEALIGFFVNTLVLRADLSGEPRVADLLARARETALGAYGHQDLPFEELVLALKPERHAAVNPLFDVALSLDDAAAPAALPGLTVEPFDFAADVAHFDLTLVVRRARAAPGGAVTLALNYRRDLFDHTTAARWLEGLATLLAGAAGEPEAPAFALPFWPDGARHQVLLEWNEARDAAVDGATVDRLVARQAALSPHALAIAAPDGRLSYAQLAAHAGRLTARLRAAGVGRGARVALVLERSPELAVAALAVLAAGAAYLPLDPSLPDGRLAEILADAAPAAVVARGAACFRLAAAPAPVLALDLPGDASRTAESSPTSSPAAPAAHGAHDADDLAYLIYTSGSTGRPKGVELAHRGLANLIAWHRERYGVAAADRASWVASPGFDASVWELWPYLAAGASVHVPPPAIARSPRELLAWLAAESITLAFLPTPLAEAVVRLAGPERPAGLALRALLTGGDHLRQAPAGELGFELVNHYGPTESTVVATAGAIPAAGPGAGPGGPPAIGRPLPGLAAYLLDGELRPVPPGARGEICLAGASLARGYLGRAEQTAERFVPHPLAAGGERLYRTGDLGRFLADGRIEFLGRTDGQVKVRGFRVELGEVEARLAAHPSVREAAVVVEPSPAGARLVACLVPRQPEAPPPATVLREHLRATLPDYMVPAAFVALESLPLTPQGKLDRVSLRDLAAASAGAGGAAVADPPQGRIEVLLAGLWREVLGMPAASSRLGAEDNFFDLGGQSLALVAVHERLRAELGMELPLVELFEHTTIRSLAARLAGQEPAEAAPEDLAAHAERQRGAAAWKERARQARMRPAP
jgi:amino acid adenylation domain-containing protein